MTRRKILITGASGRIGRALAAALPSMGYRLTLLDRLPFPDPLADDARFMLLDLNDAGALKTVAGEQAAVIHLAGISSESRFEDLVDANLRCTYHVFEAARCARARVIFASSSHVVGFHERATHLDESAVFRPDTFYGLSKLYGEGMARLYWDKYRVECLVLRIGSYEMRPLVRRHLSTWLSPRDLVGMLNAAIEIPQIGFLTIWGISNNRRAWWTDQCRERLGYQRQDDAELYAESVIADQANKVELRYQGGPFCSL